MKVEECFQLGYILKPHGINGDLVLVIESDYPEEYSNLESVFVEIKQRLIPFFIDQIRIQGDKAVISFEGIRSIEDTVQLKGAKVYLPLTELPALEDDQYYYHEIVGFHVNDHKSGDIGKVLNVYEVNGNDLLAVDCKGKEVLIPMNEQIIIKIDKINKIIEVELPEGLLDIYINP